MTFLSDERRADAVMVTVKSERSMIYGNERISLVIRVMSRKDKPM